jgi:alanine dehydrogenase
LHARDPSASIADLQSVRSRTNTMRIGVPREIKDGERRVGLVPDGVRSLVDAGHDVLVERDAGRASGFDDPQYIAQGARIVDRPEAIWECPLIVKVKEVQRAEYGRLTAGTTIIGFAQLNRDPVLLDAVLERRVRVLAYETVRDADDRLPLLAPMSRIAGRLAPIVGAHALQTQCGGNGTLITGVDAVDPARVVVIGAGNSGAEAARVAARLGCRVTVLSRGSSRLVALERSMAQEGLRVSVAQIDDQQTLDDAVAMADLVIGAVLEPGSLSPKLVTRRTLQRMRRGSAIVDIGIDQGGICETSRMTSLSHPMYVEEGIVHYAVPNMPALVARTATLALAGATLPYVRKLADGGIVAALDDDPGLARGVMVWDGLVVHPGLAADSGKTAVACAWRESTRQPVV